MHNNGLTSTTINLLFGATITFATVQGWITFWLGTVLLLASIYKVGLEIKLSRRKIKEQNESRTSVQKG